MNNVTSKFGKILKRVQDDVFRECFNRKKGFTLAEVLITLGIIGVVAALTIPTLIGNYEKTLFANKFKDSFSILSQAVNLSQAENGPLEDWDYPSVSEDRKS